MGSDLEDESQGAAKARRAQRLRQWLGETAIASVFMGAVLAAGRFVGPEPLNAASLFFVAAAAGILALWFAFYFHWLRRLDEFERVLEVSSIALAGGLTILFAAEWGLFVFILGAPDFPMVMLAPLFAGVYGIVRLLIALRYR